MRSGSHDFRASQIGGGWTLAGKKGGADSLISMKRLKSFVLDMAMLLQVRVLLPPRSLQVLSKDARYGYTHAIHVDDILDDRRVSITFRNSAVTDTKHLH